MIYVAEIRDIFKVVARILSELIKGLEKKLIAILLWPIIIS
jgi:hypothetical protein